MTAKICQAPAPSLPCVEVYVHTRKGRWCGAQTPHTRSCDANTEYSGASKWCARSRGFI